MSRMLFSELYKIMVKKVTFVGFRGEIALIAPPWIRPCSHVTSVFKMWKSCDFECV